MNNVDIYFDENYGKLYEDAENGKQLIYKFSSCNGKIENQFIKRKIPFELDGEEYYDIITPYGYGGPIITDLVGNKEKLISEYYNEFLTYCKNNKIISEFIRFHPIFNNADDFKKIYDVKYMRKTLGTKIESIENPVDFEFTKSCKKNIRQAINKGVSWKITERPDNYKDFKKIYYSTMKRNEASEYYYFNDNYFNNIQKYFNKNVILVEAIFEGQTIAAGLYFIYNGVIHIHLSGTLTEFLYLSPAYILRYAVTLWAKENKYKIIHHGGGRSNSIEDTLYKFKKGFAKNTEFDFYIGKKIWDENIYNKLCILKGLNINSDEDYFPMYRKEIK